MDSLEQHLGYKFTNSLLLAEALTHSSLAYETQRPHFDNQRLEFLGDAVLQLSLTDMIYRQFPAYNEGEMTKLRSRMVSKEALHDFAKSINLSEYMMMGKGETSTGGQHRASTLADGMEALLGAIYLDGGFEKACGVVSILVQASLTEASQATEDKNPKGLLQETLQAIVPESPKYEVVSESGPDHDKHFVIRIVWRGHELAKGEGNSKKLAERAAAQIAINDKSWSNVATS